MLWCKKTLFVLILLLFGLSARAQQLPELSDRTAEALQGLANDSNTKSLGLGDFNNDGIEDIVIARWDLDPVLLINEGGVLTNRTTEYLATPSDSANSNYVEAFDANADGLTDLVFARLGRSPWLQLNRGNDASGQWLGFAPGQGLDAATDILVIESGDLTGNGAPDLFVVQVQFGTNKLLVNDGNGNFSDQTERLGGLGELQQGHSVLLEDSDADGDLDIIYIESDRFLYVYYNDGAGNFDNLNRFAFQNTDNFAYVFGAADFNGDGFFDFRNYSNSPPMAALSDGSVDDNGLPRYAIRQDAPMTRGNRKHGTSHMRDIDGDGDIDYVLSSMMRNFGGLENTFEGMRTEIVINDGINSANFIPFAGEDWSRDESMDVRILDVNTDGNMDLFIAHQRRYAVYLNDAPPKVVEFEAVTSEPSVAGNAVSLSARLVVGSDVEYEWDFGDGEVASTTTPDISHVYQSPGRYLVSVVARNSTGSDQITMTHRVHEPLVDGRAQSSSSIVVSGANIWVVNPDHNSVSMLRSDTATPVAEISVGATPSNLIAADGLIWVANKESATLSLISPDSLSVVDEVVFKPGSRPHGLVANNEFVFVALEGTGEVARVEINNRTNITRVDVGSHPRALALNADSSFLYVPLFITKPQPGESTRAVATNGGAEVVVLNPQSMVVENIISMPYNDVEDSDRSSRGIPNYLLAPALSPNGRDAFIPAKLDNIFRGSMRDGNSREHNMLVRSLMAKIDLQSGTELFDDRVDFDNNSPPTAIAVDATGNTLFIVHEGSRVLTVFDVYRGETIFSLDVGFAPQGLVISEDGTQLYVDNMLSRTVTVYDLRALMNGQTDNIDFVIAINTVSTEVLDSQVLLGKQLFHDAGDSALTGQKYISCAVCHSEAGHDGRTWDFSDAGEGLRNTIDLRGRAGTGHGNIHWTANFDEIHDFENDIREIFDGTGLLTDDDYNRTAGILDDANPKAGLSERLDALAAFVASLDSFSDSPYRESAASLTEAGNRGREVFEAANCASCHSGVEFTDSPDQQFHNIGSVDNDTGGRLGQALVGNGLDTPTLRGLWHTAPYLHDGSAPDLAAAVMAHSSSQVGFDVTRLSAADLDDLVAYLIQIDRSEPMAILNPGGVDSELLPTVINVGTGSGCVLINGAAFDPLFLLLLLMAVASLHCRRAAALQ